MHRLADVNARAVSLHVMTYIAALHCTRRYFAELAAKASSLHAVAPPTKQQLRQAYLTLRETPEVPLADLNIACQSAGISSDTLQRVIAAGHISTASAVSILEVLLLLLTMSCDTFSTTVQGIFEVFGSTSSKDSSQLPVQDFLKLLECLGTYDSDLSSHLQQEVSKRLAGQVNTDYKGLLAIPALAGKLAA